MNLDEIKARAAAATSGPWGVSTWEDREDGGFCAAGPHHIYEDADDPDEAAYDAAQVDAVFIANARTDIPALVAEVERLRARRAEVCECVGVTMGYQQGMTVVAWFLDYSVSARVECPRCHGSGAVIVEGDA
jgi:hypothetical protein